LKILIAFLNYINSYSVAPQSFRICGILPNNFPNKCNPNFMDSASFFSKFSIAYLTKSRTSVSSSMHFSKSIEIPLRKPKEIPLTILDVTLKS